MLKHETWHKFGRNKLSMIRVTNLKKAFGAIRAVDDISFEIPDNQVFGLLGPNGAGKTTTINLIVGIINADAGSVAINGENDPTRTHLRRRIGAAPQALAIYDNLSAEENLAFFGKLYGLSGKKLKERVDWCLDLAGLQDRRRDRVGKYSGGMKRRLNMACAIVHDPPILLLDEPTVGVDPQSRNMIFDRIEMLKNDGRTIVYTTHYMEEAQRLCDRVAIIDHGKILAEGTIDSLIETHGGMGTVNAELELPVPENAKLPAELNENRLSFESSQPLQDIAALADAGVKYRSLRVERPNLEKVFLNLTGRRLRD